MTRGTDIIEAKKAYRERNEGNFPDILMVELLKEWDLKYGENPNQPGAIYSFDKINKKFARDISFLTQLESVRSDGRGKGGLSGNNTMDITRAMDTLKYFESSPAVAIMKHVNVSGFAKQTNGQSMTELFRLARDTDRQSNFGGTVAFNRLLDRETAEAMYELQEEGDPFFVDVVAAPGYEEGVLEYIESKSKNIRIGEFQGLEKLPKYVGDNTYGLQSIKEMPTGRALVQDLYLSRIKSVDDLILDPMVVKKDEKYVVERDPTERELDDCLTAWYLNIIGARSNGVVVIKDGVSVSMGSGKVERVGAVKDMIINGIQKAMDREGIKYDPLTGIIGKEKLSYNPFDSAVVSSDGFFPFDDSIDLLNRVGVSAVVQPYGSINDHIVIEALNKYEMAGPATFERCFGHF